MKNFDELNLSPPIMRAITELGYATPTPIQQETLPILLADDTDFLGLAATGTGKTAAFGIPLLERLVRNRAGVQALILCPTRELAIQVSGQIDLLGKYLGVKSLPIYGGTGYGDQIYGLKSGANVVVGTPGRVIDHIEKGTLKLDNLKTLILDEADEMISMGFQEDIERVLEAVPKDQANIWLFSATMGREVRGVADQYLKDPKQVQVNRTEMLPDTVEQIFYKIHEYDKPELLSKIIDASDEFYGIVFCQTKALVADLNNFLTERGYRVDCLHGDLDQTSRDRVMGGFREKKFTVLIATDVACRGLDVKDITHVVNYSIPRELDNYVHRIGRTGRSGKKGLALSFVTNSHRELIGRIERMTKSRMKEGTIPSAKEVARKKLERVQNSFSAVTHVSKIAEFLPEDWKAALGAMEKEEIASRFIALLLPQLLKDNRAERMQDSRAPQAEARQGRGDRGGERSDRGYRGGSRGGDRGSDRGYARRERSGEGEARRSRPSFAAGKKKFSGGERSTPWGGKPTHKAAGEKHSRVEGEKSAPHSRWKGKHAGEKKPHAHS